QDLPRLHGRDVGGDHRVRGGRLPGRLGRPRRLPAPGRGPVRGSGSRRRPSLDPGPSTRARTDASAPMKAADGRTARAFGEHPFVWITWWMKSWTSPLPGAAPSGLRWASTRSPRAQPWGRPGSLRTLSEGWMTVLPLGQWFVLPAIGEEGTPSIDPRNAASGMSDPDAGDFVRFFSRRRRVG